MKTARLPQVAMRPLSALSVLFGIVLINFVLIQATDTKRMREENLMSKSLAPEVMEQRIQAFRRDFDLDRPVWSRFGRWLGKLVRGDLGHSMVDPREVTTIIGEALSQSLWLQIPTILLIFVIGIPLGIFMAQNEGGAFDRILSSTLLGIYALPTFWVATLLLIYGATSSGLDLFPLEGLSSSGMADPGGWQFVKDRCAHLVLPLIALSLPGITVIARQTRSAMLEVLSTDFVLSARAAGIPEKTIVWKHSIRHGVFPAATLFGLLIPQLVGGSVVVESIFNIRGMGLLLWESAQSRDFPVLQALVLLSAIFTLAGFLTSDLISSRLIPSRGSA